MLKGERAVVEEAAITYIKYDLYDVQGLFHYDENWQNKWLYFSAFFIFFFLTTASALLLSPTHVKFILVAILPSSFVL